MISSELSRRSNPGIATLTARPGDRSVTELLRDSALHGQAVMRGEVRLAVAEVQDELRSGTRRVALLGAAYATALFAATLALVAGIVALAGVLAPWLAILIGAVVVASASVVLGLAALPRHKRTDTLAKDSL